MVTKNSTLNTSRRRRKSSQVWHLVTNHQNLLYMLAAGMVMGPAGFRGKHYADPLSVYPGRIPLFRDKARIPAGVLDHTTSERKHLLPCIASFDLGALSGPVQMLSRDGNKRDVAFPIARKRKGDVAILMRAPLPMTLLSGISFCSPGDLQAFASAARDVSNVDLSPHRLEVAESLFLTDTEVTWPLVQPQGQLLEADNDNPPAFGQALGGVFAMLYHAANRSDLGLAAFRLATETARDKDHGLARSNPILAGLPVWMKRGKISGQADTHARLFWEVIQSLVTAQMQARPQTPVDVVLERLDSQLGLLQETEFRSRLERLIADVHGCLGLGGGTVTELLDRHKEDPLSRPLLLFCLRERCTDLLEFSHPSLSEVEYILAGILFGARDGWLRMPRELRHPDLSAYTAWRMTEAEHRERHAQWILEPPPSPIPLRALFSLSWEEWAQKQKEVALELACECHWTECIVTRITLAPGSDPASYESNELQARIQGKITSTAEEVNGEKFMNRLGRWPPIVYERELEVRKKLKGSND